VENERGQLEHKIWFWIGNETSVDKRGVLPFHASSKIFVISD